MDVVVEEDVVVVVDVEVEAEVKEDVEMAAVVISGVSSDAANEDI